MAADNRKPVKTRRIPKPRSETSAVSEDEKEHAKSKLPTDPDARRAYAMAQWLTSLADWCEDGSAPLAFRRELRKFWDVWTNMAAKGAKDREPLLREHLYEVCHECAQGLSATYDADKAAGLVIGAMRLYVDDAATLDKLEAHRAHICTLVQAIAGGKSKRKEVTIKTAAEGLFAVLGLKVSYEVFQTTWKRRRLSNR